MDEKSIKRSLKFEHHFPNWICFPQLTINLFLQGGVSFWKVTYPLCPRKVWESSTMVMQIQQQIVARFQEFNVQKLASKYEILYEVESPQYSSTY